MTDIITEPARDADTGAWTYPEAWTPEDREAHQALAEELATEDRRLAKLEADAAATGPAKLLGAQRRLLAETKRIREAREQEAADDVVWERLVEQHGEGRVRRTYTERGSLFLRGMTEAETTAGDARAQGVVAAALEANPPDETRAARDSIKVYQDELLSKALVHPAKAKAQAIVAALPGIWPELYAARDELNRGRRVALGKGAAR